jgi:protein required for attachment to host cells
VMQRSKSVIVGDSSQQRFADASPCEEVAQKRRRLSRRACEQKVRSGTRHGRQSMGSDTTHHWGTYPKTARVS